MESEHAIELRGATVIGVAFDADDDVREFPVNLPEHSSNRQHALVITAFRFRRINRESDWLLRPCEAFLYRSWRRHEVLGRRGTEGNPGRSYPHPPVSGGRNGHSRNSAE
jgi:hypothetical protein